MNDTQQIIKREVIVHKRQLAQPLITTLSETARHPEVCYRMVGDMQVLIEYGKNKTNLAHRFRVDALEKAILNLQLKGVLKIIPGIRSLMVRYNPFILSLETLIEKLEELENSIGNISNYAVPSRIVKLPIAYNHSLINKVIGHYIKTVKNSGPHLPDNLGFIAKCNGIVDKEALIKKHASTDYMVMGGGENISSAICGYSLDPRVQFVVPKYNPIRAWTPEGSVGFGGPFLRIYPVDSPGGSQLMGRTIPIFKPGDDNQPVTSLLNSYDRIRFYEVEEKELEEIREKVKNNNFKIDIQKSEFNLSDYQEFLSTVEKEAAVLKKEQKEFFKAWTKSY